MTTDPADEGSDHSIGSIVRHANFRVKELVMPQYPRREAPPPATRPVWPRRSVRFPEFPGNLVEHLSEARQLRYSSAASSQGAPLDITDCLNDLYAGATPVVRFKRASAEAA